MATEKEKNLMPIPKRRPLDAFLMARVSIHLRIMGQGEGEDSNVEVL